MNPKLSMHQCGFLKNLSVQNCLLVMLEKCRKCLNDRVPPVLLTDVYKLFHCLIHDLLIAKLNSYGFDYNSLKLIYSYIGNRLQRVRINCS